MNLIKSNEVENLQINDIKKLYEDYVSKSQVKLLSSFEFGNDV